MNKTIQPNGSRHRAQRHKSKTSPGRVLQQPGRVIACGKSDRIAHLVLPSVRYIVRENRAIEPLQGVFDRLEGDLRCDGERRWDSGQLRNGTPCRMGEAETVEKSLVGRLGHAPTVTCLSPAVK